LTLYTLISYVNAIATYSPSTVSQYIPNFRPTADAGSDKEVILGQTVTLNGFGSEDTDGAIVTYSWSFGDGASATGVRVKHEYTQEGVYEVNLTVTDNDGDSDSTVITITVSARERELPEITIAFTTTPTQIVVGESYTISVEVTNIGEGEATDFEVTIEGSALIVENGDVRWISIDIGSNKIDRLPAGASQTVDFSFSPEIEGAYSLEAIADPTETLPEGSRENNVAEFQTEVENKPPNYTTQIVIGGAVIIALAVVLYYYREQVNKYISNYI
jgi:PKD repeat protein